jgi:hypothetical protein
MTNYLVLRYNDLGNSTFGLTDMLPQYVRAGELHSAAGTNSLNLPLMRL